MMTSERFQLLMLNALSIDSIMQPRKKKPPIGRRNICMRSQTTAAPTSTICASSCYICWYRLRMFYVSPLEDVCFGSIASHEASKRNRLLPRYGSMQTTEYGGCIAPTSSCSHRHLKRRRSTYSTLASRQVSQHLRDLFAMVEDADARYGSLR